MANNRMYLVNRRTGASVYIGKYYPSTGWYVDNDTLAEGIGAAFHLSDFGPDVSPEEVCATWDDPTRSLVAAGGMWGDCAWAIHYESVNGVSDDATAQVKNAVMNAFQGD